MKSALPLCFGLFVLFLPTVRANDPSKVKPGQQNTQFAPSDDNIDTRLTSGNADNQLPFKRAERMQNKLFTTPELRDKQLAPTGDRRAPIDVKETRDKTIIDRKNYPQPEVHDHKMSADNAQMFQTQPKGDAIKKYDLVGKYQNRMTDAATAAAQRQPKLEKRTTFDKLNRFVFRRNGPNEDGNSLVTKAGGGSAAAVSGSAKKTADVPPPPQLQPARTAIR